jgi:hypothetical protein
LIYDYSSWLQLFGIRHEVNNFCYKLSSIHNIISLRSELYSEILLVDTLERRNSLALSLIQSVSNDAAITELDVRAVRIMLEGQSVLHPVVIITL